MTTTHRITTAVILSLAAAGAPTATATASGANPATTANQPPTTAVYSRPDKSMISVTTPASAPQAVVRIQTPQNGFDWGDAGIGAAGGLALATLGVGGVLAVSQRRPHRTRQTTPIS